MSGSFASNGRRLGAKASARAEPPNCIFPTIKSLEYYNAEEALWILLVEPSKNDSRYAAKFDHTGLHIRVGQTDFVQPGPKEKVALKMIAKFQTARWTMREVDGYQMFDQGRVIDFDTLDFEHLAFKLVTTGEISEGRGSDGADDLLVRLRQYLHQISVSGAEMWIRFSFHVPFIAQWAKVVREYAIRRIGKAESNLSTDHKFGQNDFVDVERAGGTNEPLAQCPIAVNPAVFVEDSMHTFFEYWSMDDRTWICPSELQSPDFRFSVRSGYLMLYVHTYTEEHLPKLRGMSFRGPETLHRMKIVRDNAMDVKTWVLCWDLEKDIIGYGVDEMSISRSGYFNVNFAVHINWRGLFSTMGDAVVAHHHRARVENNAQVLEKIFLTIKDELSSCLDPVASVWIRFRSQKPVSRTAAFLREIKAAHHLGRDTSDLPWRLSKPRKSSKKSKSKVAKTASTDMTSGLTTPVKRTLTVTSSTQSTPVKPAPEKLTPINTPSGRSTPIKAALEKRAFVPPHLRIKPSTTQSSEPSQVGQHTVEKLGQEYIAPKIESKNFFPEPVQSKAVPLPTQSNTITNSPQWERQLAELSLPWVLQQKAFFDPQSVPAKVRATQPSTVQQAFEGKVRLEKPVLEKSDALSESLMVLAERIIEEVASQKSLVPSFGPKSMFAPARLSNDGFRKDLRPPLGDTLASSLTNAAGRAPEHELEEEKSTEKAKEDLTREENAQVIFDKPTEPTEEPFILQKRFMKEVSLRVHQRRLEEERAVEEAKRERFRKTFSYMADTIQKSTNSEAESASKFERVSILENINCEKMASEPELGSSLHLKALFEKLMPSPEACQPNFGKEDFDDVLGNRPMQSKSDALADVHGDVGTGTDYAIPTLDQIWKNIGKISVVQTVMDEKATKKSATRFKSPIGQDKPPAQNRVNEGLISTDDLFEVGKPPSRQHTRSPSAPRFSNTEHVVSSSAFEDMLTLLSSNIGGEIMTPSVRDKSSITNSDHKGMASANKTPSTTAKLGTPKTDSADGTEEQDAADFSDDDLIDFSAVIRTPGPPRVEDLWESTPSTMPRNSVRVEQRPCSTSYEYTIRRKPEAFAKDYFASLPLPPPPTLLTPILQPHTQVAYNPMYTQAPDMEIAYLQATETGDERFHQLMLMSERSRIAAELAEVNREIALMQEKVALEEELRSLSLEHCGPCDENCNQNFGRR